MLGLILDGHLLELDPATSLNITLANPAFDAARIARTYSYPSRVPLTDANRQGLGHQHRLDSTTRKQYLPAEVRLAGTSFDRGRAVIDEHTDKNSQIIFQNNDLTAVEALSAINIRDLMPVEAIPQTNESLYVLEPVGGPNYQLTINGTLYSAGGLGVPLATAMNDLAADINTDYPGTASYSVGDNEFYLETTEDEWVVSFNVTDFTLISERTLGDARELNLQEYITDAVTSGNEKLAFPVVYVPEIYPYILSLRFSGYANWRVDGNYLTNEHVAINSYRGWKVTYIPFVRVRYVLDQIAAEAGLSDIVFEMSAAKAADLDALLIFNNRTLDDLRIENVVTGNLGEAEKNGFATEIDMAQHVPDYTAAELIDRIAGFFNLNKRFEGDILRLYENAAQLGPPAQNWTPLSAPQFQRTTTEGGGVVLTYEKDVDPAYAPDHNDQTVGDGSNTWTLPARPIHDRFLPNFENGNDRWRIAAYEHRGTSEAIDQETELETLRLFFDREQQTDEGGATYWQGSVRHYGGYLNTVVGAFSLTLTDKDGLYETFWQGWTGLLFSPTVTRIIPLPVPELLSIRQWEGTKVYIYSDEGAMLGIVERVQVKATARGIGQAKVEIRKFET